MSITIHQVDSFTNRPFAGNPAGVCVLAQPRDEGWMQQVAAEMNLSETAFLQARPDDPPSGPEGRTAWNLRWFTPTVEVDLCGHATLASAHVLWETGRLPPGETAIFHTRSGRLSARKLDEWIELDFPTRPPAECPAPPQLVQGLGVEPAWVGANGDNYLAEFECERVVRALDPDFGLLKRLRAGVIVTSRSDDTAFDFVSRYFAPSYGIDEDPATGSTHCTLGPHWADRLGRNALVGHQVSSRGGVVRVRVDGERTNLGGQAVTVMRAELSQEVPSFAYSPR